MKDHNDCSISANVHESSNEHSQCIFPMKTDSDCRSIHWAIAFVQHQCEISKLSYKPLHKKTNNLGIRLVPTQSQKQDRSFKPYNFGFTKKRGCTIHAVKTKALISCAVTAQLICAFVFAYADCWFSDAAVHVISTLLSYIHCY